MKRRKHAGKLRLVLIVSALMLLSISCRTVTETAIEITIDWPTFPDPRGVTVLSPDGKIVAMPIDYWLLIAEYVISVREVRGRIEAAEGGPVVIDGGSP